LGGKIMAHWQSDNWTNPDAYGASGTPWCQTFTLSGTVTEITFPTVTRWIQIINTNTTPGNSAKVGFTENGVNGNPVDNHFIVPGGTESGRLELRCLKLFLLAGAGSPVVSVIAGMTQIPKDFMIQVTGSSDVSGVG
jgi:hypothetical protein